MIDLEEVRLIALSDACEDYSGFYELIWELNTRYPAESRDGKVRSATAVLTQLFNDGLVEIAYAPSWPPPEFVRVDDANALARIADPSSYLDPTAESGLYAYSATDAGERAYGEIPSSKFVGLWPSRPETESAN